MGIFHDTCEIIELSDEFDDMMRSSQKHSIVADINELFDDIKTLAKEKYVLSSKSAMKRPIIVDSPAESMNLKHSLRGLCISQASEIAANRRLSNPTTLSADTIRMLYKTLVLEPSKSELSFNGSKKTGNSLEMEFSLSSKSSDGDYSSNTSISDEENSWCSLSVRRTQKLKDFRCQTICDFHKQHGKMRMEDFKLVEKMGHGSIGTIYVAALIGTNCLYGLKVMESEMGRACNEKEIMEMLEHPFLPSLYSHFTTDKTACLLMEYCSGGDLHALLQKQPSMRFSEEAARFYVAEVLLALEYLHMHGVIYQNLNTKNILIRGDGHIMLTNFDSSYRQIAPNPIFLRESPHPQKPKSCISSSCFLTPLSRKLKRRNKQANGNMRVVEPRSVQSDSGTHGYLAPEIVSEDGYGSGVDWWALGVFLYEMLFGKMPFKDFGGVDGLEFCGDFGMSFKAKDLIRKLMVKEPMKRLGCVYGASQIKEHPFFEGLNWGLVHCATPPHVPTHLDPNEFQFGVFRE